jgi:hypothetical protein
MMVILNEEDGDMKTGTSISIVAAVMFNHPDAFGAALIHMPIKEAQKLRPAFAT